jgi:hypothetical protein
MAHYFLLVFPPLLSLYIILLYFFFLFVLLFSTWNEVKRRAIYKSTQICCEFYLCDIKYISAFPFLLQTPDDSLTLLKASRTERISSISERNGFCYSKFYQLPFILKVLIFILFQIKIRELHCLPDVAQIATV